MKRLMCFLGLVLLLGPPAFPYLAPLSLEDLLQRSQAVLIGTVGATRSLPDHEPYRFFTTEIRVDQPLFGLPASTTSIPVVTVLLQPGKKREDPPIALPASGSTGVFFLKRDEKDRWRLVNSRQGFWLMQDGDIAVPGRPRIAVVKEAVRARSGE